MEKWDARRRKEPEAGSRPMDSKLIDDLEEGEYVPNPIESHTLVSHFNG
jgi:hypothetical protein